MQEPKVVSPSRIERLIDLACAYNVPLSVNAESGDKTYRYKSRMLEKKKTPGSTRLIIDQPVTDGPAIALKPKTQITLFFALEQGRFAFDSAVLRKTTFALGSRRSIAALEITYPNVLKSGQRRAFYRVDIPLIRPVDIECGIIGDVAGPDAEEAGARNFLSRTRFEGRTVNISAGGMLVTIEMADSISSEVGTKLVLQFSLAKNETPLRLKGIIRRVETKPSTKEVRVAIEFVDTAETFEYKLAINRLYRFIAEKQREIILSEAKKPGD